jgi:hypothetical protein
MSTEFDKKDRGKLISMLTERGVNKHLISIVNSFLPDRVQTVRIGSFHSSEKITTNGNPQGTLLGPMFWLLYVDSLETSCHTIKYADNITLAAQTTKALQTSINEVYRWCEDHNMTANAKKFVIMNLSNKQTTHDLPEEAIYLEKEKIPSAHHTKSLGAVFEMGQYAGVRRTLNDPQWGYVLQVRIPTH